MSIKNELIPTNKGSPKGFVVTFRVKDENGVSRPIDFCMPLDQEDFEEELGKKLAEFVAEHPGLAEIPGLMTLLEELKTD